MYISDLNDHDMVAGATWTFITDFHDRYRIEDSQWSA
jgi:hypothetical protein